MPSSTHPAPSAAETQSGASKCCRESGSEMSPQSNTSALPLPSWGLQKQIAKPSPGEKVNTTGKPMGKQRAWFGEVGGTGAVAAQEGIKGGKKP